MTKAQKTITAILSAVVCVLLVVVGYAGAQVYEDWSAQPLGPALPTSPYTPIPLPATWTASPPASYFFNGTNLSVATPVPTITPYRYARCGGPNVMNILAIGSDTRGTSYTYGLSDVMRVVRVDFVTPRITTLDFPRDLWVQIPYIASHLNGQDHEKLNQAYLYGNPGDGFGYWSDPSAGPGLLARTLDLNFGVKVDHYIAVNMKTFVKMVDAVGGIDVTFDQPLPGSDDPDLQKGTHHLNGTKALEVARNRVDGVFSRGEFQNLVLCALQKKLTSPGMLLQIPKLINSFQDSVQTDLSPQIMAQLACLGTQLPRENITLYSFPENLFTGTRIYDPVFKKDLFIWDVDFSILRQYVTQFSAGSWPTTSTPSTSETSPYYCK